MTTTMIRPLPADAYNEGLFAAYLDKNTFLNIHAVRGIHVSWLFATLLDADSEDVIDEHRCRLEHDGPREPVFFFVRGKPLMFDPVSRRAWFADRGEHDESNVAVRMAEAVDG